MNPIPARSPLHSAPLGTAQRGPTRHTCACLTCEGDHVASSSIHTTKWCLIWNRNLLRSDLSKLFTSIGAVPQRSPECSSDHQRRYSGEGEQHQVPGRARHRRPFLATNITSLARKAQQRIPTWVSETVDLKYIALYKCFF